MSANIVYQHFSTVNTLVLNFNKKAENFRPCIATYFLDALSKEIHPLMI